jgi:hypothetical protein
MERAHDPAFRQHLHGDPLHDGYFARARLGVHPGMRFGASGTRR